MSRTIPAAAWRETLQQFTDRNAGRVTTLEERFGNVTQDEERGLPLRRVAYDDRDGRVAIMLGELEGADGHLTRNIEHVHHVQLLSSPEGRDLALHVHRTDGETILRFTDNYS